METEAIDNQANLVNYDNENENEIDDLGYQSEEYIEVAHEDDVLKLKWRVPSMFFRIQWDEIEKKEIEPDEEPTRGTLWLKGRVNKDGEVSDVRKGVVMQEAWEVEGIQEETVKSVGAKKTTRSIQKDSLSQDSQSKEMCRQHHQVHTMNHGENKIAPKVQTKRKNVYVSNDAMQKEASKKRS
ncbi:hypothetical protein Tco_1575965 [Tanacetum coccineum]